MIMLAVVITERTLKFISKLNDGVEPPLPSEEGNYFLTPVEAIDSEFNEIVTPKSFYDQFPQAHKKAVIQTLIKR